jgi:hypothetical protein
MKDPNNKELNTDHIMVDHNGGNIFDGTRDQFEECFFSNATDEQIVDWCRKTGFSLDINGVTVLAKSDDGFPPLKAETISLTKLELAEFMIDVEHKTGWSESSFRIARFLCMNVTDREPK